MNWQRTLWVVAALLCQGLFYVFGYLVASLIWESLQLWRWTT